MTSKVLNINADSKGGERTNPKPGTTQGVLIGLACCVKEPAVLPCSALDYVLETLPMLEAHLVVTSLQRNVYHSLLSLPDC